MKQILSIITCLLLAINLYAQKSLESSVFIPLEKESTGSIMRKDFGNTWRGITHFYTSPLRWKKKDYIQLGIVAGSFAALTFVDEDVQPYFERQEPKVPKAIKDFGFWFGGPINAVVFSGGLYTYGLLAKKNKVKKTGILMMSSIAAAGFLQTVVKTALGRGRPTAKAGNKAFKPFSPEVEYHSFPSGHSVVSLVFVHTIARQIDNPYAKVALYSVGSIAPISRMWSNSHWISDIALGSFLGILTVNHIDRYLTKIYEGKVDEKLTNTWKFNAGIGNMKLSYTFN